jgi:hypothetical protein
VAKGFEEWTHPIDHEEQRADLGGLSLAELKAIRFEELGQFKQARRFPSGYSGETLTFYSPRDTGVHQVIVWTLLQVTTSVAINMYGFDDPHTAAILREHSEKKDVAVTMSLDSSQAGGVAEKKLLSQFNNDLIGNSIAIGRSARGAISHDKMMVVDGVYMINGSTNWSFGGELLQDNQLTLTRDPVAAAEARSVIDLNHDAMLKQMAKKRASDAMKPHATEPEPVPAGHAAGG